ncbi:pyridoxal phosphate-dependent aminotransferase [Fluviispira multicolorata]|uniref:Aminotransferase n=1 Tax=Fluviispira multicolorata TaxID=2654512 RepID=A0A833JEM3_9BACT|nr:pyridoxal phosphate-dependent aminotransferase [Fluviispira multicolorata]KAB8030020.1 pyridoxal phosphate-dependent aminotransferase [Fluviispira multicolorata]
MDQNNNFYVQDFYAKKFNELSNVGGDIRRMFMLGQNLLQENPEADLIDLSLGNPDLEPPEIVKKSIKKLLEDDQQGEHRYMDFAGLPEVRKYIAQELSQSEIAQISQDTVYLTVGAAGGIQILLRIFLEQDDEAIIFAPYFPEYIPYILNYNAKPITVKCDENHEPNLDDLQIKISDKTKVILMNSPNNPSGVLYSKETVKKIVKILEERKTKTGQCIQLISDEPYSRIVFKNKHVPSILENYKYSWLIRSFSKDIGLAGERIGYIAWSEDKSKLGAINALRNSGRVLGFVGAPRLMQRILPHVFNARVDVNLYEQRVNKFIGILAEGGIKTVHPSAGFFVFPKSPIQDDRMFCEGLVAKGVLCVPGSGFGCSGYFRASLTQPIEKIEEAARRISLYTKEI